MVIAATCGTIAAALATAQGGEVIELRGVCPKITIVRHYGRPVTVNASASLIRGLEITGGNISWRGGTITAPGGAYGRGPIGYGVNLKKGAARIRFEGVTFTDAHRGIAADGIADLTVLDSRFLELGSDGLIINESRNIVVQRNRFSGTKPRPTICKAGAQETLGLSRRACVASGGTWSDGDHPDAVQLRNGTRDVLIADNVVDGRTQGLSQMDRDIDAPLERVHIRHNVITTDNPHKATLSRCVDCSVTNNVVRRPPGSQWKAVIIPGPGVRCGNVQEDAKDKERACPS